MNKKTLYISEIGLLSAFAIILSYVETLIPIPIAVPGVKLGLANFLVLLCLYIYGIKEAIIVNLIRIFVIGCMFGNLFSILFSIAGAGISLMVMVMVKKTNLFSMTGVSVAGGVSHNMAQILIAAWLVNSTQIVFYLPVLVVCGIVTGAVIGILAGVIVKHIPGKQINRNGDKIL